MTAAVAFGLLAALSNALSALLSKDLALRMPARQLIGPLFALNALVVLPLAPTASWHWSPTIIGLHLLSVVALSVSALAVWDLFANGAASAVTTAQAMSPLPAVIAVAILLPETFRISHAAAAVVVVVAVLAAITHAFGALGRRRTALNALLASAGTGLVTVLGRLLVDQGVGIVEIYLVRASLAALVFLALIPPRDIPVRALPSMTVRAALISLSFLFILLGVEQGSPAVVQTLVATTPLAVVALEVLRGRERPSARVAAGALGAFVGVAVILLS